MTYSMCPNLNCQANWGSEEISFQECDCCGWPNNDDYEDVYDEEEPDYSDFDCTCGAWEWSDKLSEPIHLADCICGSSEPW